MSSQSLKVKADAKTSRRVVPKRARVERDLPVEALVPLAIREGNRKKPIYEIHKWWARRLGSNFRMLLLSALLPSKTTDVRLWKEFYSTHKWRRPVVMDPFMGGGTSIVEATKLGARTVGNDIDPVAWFITKKEVEAHDAARIQAAFDLLESKLATRLKRFYKYKDAAGREFDVTTYFWVTIAECEECKTEIEAHPHFQLFIDEENHKQAVFCRSCHQVEWLHSRRKNFTCSSCATKTEIFAGPVDNGEYSCSCGHKGALHALAKPGQPLATRIFALEYELPEGKVREFTAAREPERALYAEAEAEFERTKADLPFPRDLIPTLDRRDNRPVSYGFAAYHQLFNRRQLLALSLIYKEILALPDDSAREYLLLAFSDSLASNNMLCSYAFGYRKLTPLFGMHAYRMVTRPVEGNVWGARFGRGSFVKCFEKLVRGKEYCTKPFEFIGDERDRSYTKETIDATTTMDPEVWESGEARSLLLNTNSSALVSVKAASVDVILTDPPYYNNLPYSELSDFYYVWLRDVLPYASQRWNKPTTPYRETLLVRKLSADEHERFGEGMRSVFAECKRVLRPDGLMVFTYHHNDMRAWMVIGDALSKAGFEITNVMPLLAEGKSGFHSAEGNIKWDAVLVCRPRSTTHRVVGFVADETVAFAKKRLAFWKKRLAKTARKMSHADAASLAHAFALQHLVGLGANTHQIVNALFGVSEKINGDRNLPWLFRPNGPSASARKPAKRLLKNKKRGRAKRAR